MIGYDLPVEIEIGGKKYPITNRGDFRMILDCFFVLNDKRIPGFMRPNTALIIFYKDINSDDDIKYVFGEHREEAIKKMYSFFNCNQVEIGTKTNYKLIDWESDAQLVCAAVNTVAQTEVRSEPYLHWFTFMGYYISIGDSVLATVIGLRYKMKRGKKLEKEEKEFINNNPQYFTTKAELEEKQELEKELLKVWGK